MALTAYITTAGQAAIADASIFGYKIDLVRFKIGDTLITATDPAIIRNYSTLPGTIVYDSGNNPTDNTLTAQVSEDSGVVITIYLNTSIGDFTLGSAGLYLSDGTLFAILKVEETYEKVKNAGSIAGNAISFPFVFAITVQSVLNLEILSETIASLPIVSDESELPAYNLAPYSNYFVQEYSGTGRSAIACKFADEWQFCLASQDNLFDGWLEVGSSAFESGIVEGDVVYLNTSTSKWTLVDGLGDERPGIGVRQGNGVRINSFFYKENAYIAGTTYYVDSYPSLGKLTTLGTKQIIGTAITSSLLSISPQYIADEELTTPSNSIEHYDAIVNGSNVYILTNEAGVYPSSYSQGQIIQFVVPKASIAGQRLQIGNLASTQITQGDIITTTSGIPVIANSLKAGALVTLTYLSIDAGFRAELDDTYIPGQRYVGRLPVSAGTTVTLEQTLGSVDAYEFRFVGLVPSANGSFLGAEISLDGGLNWIQTGYAQSKIWTLASTTTLANYVEKGTGITIAGRDGDATTGVSDVLASGGLCGTMIVTRKIGNAAIDLQWRTIHITNNPTSLVGEAIGKGAYVGAAVPNRIRFRWVAANGTTTVGTFSAGYIEVYERTL